MVWLTLSTQKTTSLKRGNKLGRRVLVTGLGSFWGGRVALALEADPDVGMIVGLDTKEPSYSLEKTEFVRSDQSYSILSRIVKATQPDTVIHTFLKVSSSKVSSRQINERNVIGTMNLLAACSGSPSVRQIIVKSSTLVYGSNAEDPVWFSEGTARSRNAKTKVEKSLLEVEGYLGDYAEDNPHVVVSLLRFSNVLGREIETPLTRLLSKPMVPMIAGFDPRLQFVEETDVIRAIGFVFSKRVAGLYNVAADGLIPWSEVIKMLGKRPFPISPLGTGVITDTLKRFGIAEFPPEVIDLLKFGRGTDNRRLKELGFDYLFDSAGAIDSWSRSERLAKSMKGNSGEYKYQQDVENFFRHSPAVVRNS